VVNLVDSKGYVPGKPGKLSMKAFTVGLVALEI